MQLHYNIIWVDDEINKFQEVGDVDRVSEYLIDLGFTPMIIPLKNGAEIDAYTDKYPFDLILSDFSIEEGHHGDEIIKHLRAKKVLSEVLFYTSQVNELENIARKLLTVDRISFHSGRRGLIDKVESLIKLSVSKILELNATRGLITAETSSLDVMIEEIVLELIYRKLKLTKPEIDNIVTSYVDDFLRRSPDSFLRKYGSEGFEKLFYRIEANRKWSILRDLLKKIDSPEVRVFLKTNKTYNDDVISIRNKFAHAKAIVKENKMFLSGFGPDGDHFEFDEEQCISIRKKLIEHRNNFNQLSEYLSK